jgi:hypothetical protein
MWESIVVNSAYRRELIGQIEYCEADTSWRMLIANAAGGANEMLATTNPLATIRRSAIFSRHFRLIGFGCDMELVARIEL